MFGWRFGPVEGEGGPFTPAQISLRWIIRQPEVGTVVAGMNNLVELEENLEAITKEGEIDEKVLDRYLNRAQSPQARERLSEMLKDPAVDISHFAKEALEGSQMEESHARSQGSSAVGRRLGEGPRLVETSHRETS